MEGKKYCSIYSVYCCSGILKEKILCSIYLIKGCSGMFKEKLLCTIYIYTFVFTKKSHILELVIFICSKHHNKDAEYNLYIIFWKEQPF